MALESHVILVAEAVVAALMHMFTAKSVFFDAARFITGSSALGNGSQAVLASVEILLELELFTGVAFVVGEGSTGYAEVFRTGFAPQSVLGKVLGRAS